MPGAILTDPIEYDSIRELLGVEWEDIPNATIELTPYLPAAELSVKTLVSDWATRMADPDDSVRLKTVVACRVAAALVSRMANRQRAKERLGEYTAGEINWEARKAELAALADDAIAGLLYDADTPVPGVFTVDGVSRQAAASETLDLWPVVWP